MCTAFFNLPVSKGQNYESLCSHHLDESDLIPELLSVFLGEEASETIEFVQPKA